jgi:lipoate-protein ligase A
VEVVSSVRLIHDPPAAGDWNMAVDEMMLETAAATGQSILRFYQWEEPTLSLGYFQNLEDRQVHRASLNCPVVRRSSGGGAILHDRELTYSLAMPVANRWSRTAANLYDTMHQGLIAVLRKMGVGTALCPATDSELQKKFLCFQRRAAGDVLVEGHKLAGSAQRRRQGALLQHGSVILACSASAPEIIGLEELGMRMTATALASQWWAEVRSHWPASSDQRSCWSPAELDQARAIATSRFSSSEWLQRRSGGATVRQAGV